MLAPRPRAEVPEVFRQHVCAFLCVCRERAGLRIGRLAVARVAMWRIDLLAARTDPGFWPSGLVVAERLFTGIANAARDFRYSAFASRARVAIRIRIRGSEYSQE